MKRRAKLKGFTLVELLIVIVVIGVLSAMMMLSSTEAVSSAKAADIVSNLRNWKTAALAWYADNLDKVNGKGKIKTSDADNYSGKFDTSNTTVIAEIAKYLGNSNEFTSSGGKLLDTSGGEYYPDWYSTNTNDGPFKWYIVYKMPTDDKTLQSKLEARAKTTGLTNKRSGSDGTGNTDSYTAAVGKQWVSICVLDFTQ